MLSPLAILAIGVVLIVVLIVFLRINAFLALLLAALTVSFLAGPPAESRGDWLVCVTRVMYWIGHFTGQLGVVIAMGAIIGNMMLLSGAADRIVLAIYRFFGEKRVPAALFCSGFILSIPVFYDTTLFLLIPLARSVYKKVRKNYILYLTAIGAGATTTHVLVPPTPGPLLIASQLGITVGAMMFVGLLVGLLMSPISLAISYLVNWYMPNPHILEDEDSLPDTQPDIRQGTSPDEENAENPLATTSGRTLPPLALSLLPLLLPVVLIATQSVMTLWINPRLEQNVRTVAADYSLDLSEYTAKTIRDKGPLFLIDAFPEDAQAAVMKTSALLLTVKRSLDVFGSKEIAMILGAAIAILMLLRWPGMSFHSMQDHIEKTLLGAALIVLITASGGAFGRMLDTAGVGDAIAVLFVGEGESESSQDAATPLDASRSDTISDGSSALSGSLLILMAFSMSALIKTAQGSSTIAMLTAAGIVGPLIHGADLGFSPAYVAVAIGCGSIVVGWMNDSGFWAFCRMGRISETDALKTWTVQLGIMGVTGVLIVLVLIRVLPMPGLT